MAQAGRSESGHWPGAQTKARKWRTARMIASSAAAGATVARETALDLIRDKRHARVHAAAGAARTSKSILVNRPVDEVYRFWRDVENLPRVMSYLKDVHPIDERRSHWVAVGPRGSEVAWDAEISEDRPGERIAWRSLDGAAVLYRGAVELQPLPAGRGTRLRVELRYELPLGALQLALAKLFRSGPERRLKSDLRRFKQLIETGEIARAHGPHGRRSLVSARLP